MINKSSLKTKNTGSSNNKTGQNNPSTGGKRFKKLSEYGKQLQEKQKVKNIYGMREKQFRRFFKLGSGLKGAPGDNLLGLLERRLDNVIYRLKLSVSREQARQMIVHGHVLVNKKKVSSPSFLVKVKDFVSLREGSIEKKEFIKSVVEKRLNLAIKVPEWLELEKKNMAGRVLRLPVRSDMKTQIEDHLIVELYSK